MPGREDKAAHNKDIRRNRLLSPFRNEAITINFLSNRLLYFAGPNMTLVIQRYKYRKKIINHLITMFNNEKHRQYTPQTRIKANKFKKAKTEKQHQILFVRLNWVPGD